jgi:hypothetical protein
VTSSSVVIRRCGEVTDGARRHGTKREVRDERQAFGRFP